jgi:cytoskeletal protein RodZ
LLLVLLLVCLGGVLWWIFRGTPDDNATPAASSSSSIAATVAPPVVTTPPAATTPPATATPPATTAPTATPGTGTMITVPDVVGKNADDAEKTLKDAGFTKVTFVAKNGGAVQLLNEWKVDSQTPVGKTSAPADTEIILTVVSNKDVGGGLG